MPLYNPVSTSQSSLLPTQPWRLSLSSSDPYPSGNTGTVTNLYCVGIGGPYILLPNADSSAITSYPMATNVLSLALSGMTAGIPVDVFAREVSGTVTLEIENWSTATTRANALALIHGYYRSTSNTRRMYLGTILPTSATQTAQRTAPVAGTSVHLGVWNMFNQAPLSFRMLGPQTSWTYTTNTWRQCNGSSSYQIDFVAGFSGTRGAMSAHLGALARNSVNNVSRRVAFGLDSTTAPSADCVVGFGNGPADLALPMHSHIVTHPAAGKHSLTWIEQSTASGTTTWFAFADSVDLAVTGCYWC